MAEWASKGRITDVTTVTATIQFQGITYTPTDLSHLFHHLSRTLGNDMTGQLGQMADRAIVRR